MNAGGGAKPRWSAYTIALHWSSALLILALLGLGWFMVHGDIAAGARFDLYQLHKSLGFLSLALLLLRFGARLMQAPPSSPPTMPQWERRMAGLTHVTFYGLMLIAVLSGWLLVSAAIIAIPTRFFGLFTIPNLTGPGMNLEADMVLLHYWISRLTIGLIVLHVAAAMKHHVFDRDDVLKQMLALRR